MREFVAANIDEARTEVARLVRVHEETGEDTYVEALALVIAWKLNREQFDADYAKKFWGGVQPSVDREIDDNDNAAEDVRRKLWRMESALKVLNADAAMKPRVWAVLRFMSRGNPDAGVALWVTWLRRHGIEDSEARRLWSVGYGDVSATANEIYAVAQRQGWRYPMWNNPARINLMVPRTEQALARAGAKVYQAGGKLVRPASVLVDATKGRRTRIARLIEFAFPDLRREISEYVDFIGERAKLIAPPELVVSAMLAGYGRWSFPTLSGVICAPTLRRDGSVLRQEGFDETTGLLVVGPLPAMLAVKDEPSFDDAIGAVGMLNELLGEFPFVDDASRAVALSGMLSTVCRAALSCVPMHASSAPAYGTGKSFLWDIIAAIVLGDVMPIIGAEKFEELIKRLDGEIIEGINLLSLDNVSFPLGGDTLCQVLERPAYIPRILGKSSMKERRNNWCVFASGKNLRLKDDVTRRSVLVRLDAGLERPELREFQANPLDRVLANRSRYLWACLTVVKAYMAAGTPGRLPRIGDPFAEWSDLVRSGLVWLGFEDPVKTMEAVRETDPSRQARIALFQAIANAYGVGVDARRSASRMIEDAKTGTIRKLGGKRLDILNRASGGEDAANDLKAAIIGYTDNYLNARHFGNKLNTDRNAIAGELQLCSWYDSHSKVNHWYVGPIDDHDDEIRPNTDPNWREKMREFRSKHD
jgi:hypothetical protein